MCVVFCQTVRWPSGDHMKSTAFMCNRSLSVQISQREYWRGTMLNNDICHCWCNITNRCWCFPATMRSFLAIILLPCGLHSVICPVDKMYSSTGGFLGCSERGFLQDTFNRSTRLHAATFFWVCHVVCMWLEDLDNTIGEFHGSWMGTKKKNESNSLVGFETSAC